MRGENPRRFSASSSVLIFPSSMALILILLLCRSMEHGLEMAWSKEPWRKRDSEMAWSIGAWRKSALLQKV
jgi:hypothetical protein